MPYSAIKVANEFLRLARESEPARSLTPLQLMKLVYIAHGWSLALRDRALLSDTVEAWKYGPVIPDLYQKIKKFGSSGITEELNEGIWSFGAAISDDDRALIKDVHAKYGKYNGVQLSNLTHMPGTPWAEVYEPNTFGIDVPDNIIAAHYKQLAKERGGR
ncbi:Panacea domain-containing protein [uncultured Enterovirga sp.]|uniref:Panacea domain-containing protein n=1 Tax=uncultured Enterovirga sp. TaxID=2026352 RepID=UPI0035C97C35